VLAIGHIMSAAHNAVLRVVQREHLASGTRQDADKPRGLNGRLLHDIVTWQKPRVSDAFSKLAKATNAKSLQTAALYGVHVRHEAGIEGVIETARAANVALVTNATSDFLDQIRQALEEHEGETSDEISAALQDRVGVSKSRGTLIARDQVTKLNGKITEHRQRSAGVKKFTWSTSEDERVRKDVEWSASDGREGSEAHAELDGKVFDWDDPPILDGEVSTPGQPIQCFPEGSELQLAHGVVKCIRRWYDGELAEVVTHSGKTVRATPNHPVLTRRGWVALGSLQLTDDVLEISEEHDEHDRVASMGDVFHALSVLGVGHPARSIRADFHGDGADGHVDIVLPAIPLTFGVLTGAALTNAIGPHADSAEFLAQIVGVDRERSGHFLQGLPCVQQFARVRSINRLPFHGFVFNLETTTAWYAVSGIIAHNCRCVAIPVIEDLEDPDEDDDDETGEAGEGDDEEAAE
jgi:SPP1 gp7 family putative phage head morphogenesis protein